MNDEEIYCSKCLFYVGTNWSGVIQNSDMDYFYDYYYSFDFKQLICIKRNSLDPKEIINNEIDILSDSMKTSVHENPIKSVLTIRKAIDQVLEDFLKNHSINSYDELREIIAKNLSSIKDSVLRSFEGEYFSKEEPLTRERKFSFLKKNKKN